MKVDLTIMHALKVPRIWEIEAKLDQAISENERRKLLSEAAINCGLTTLGAHSFSTDFHTAMRFRYKFKNGYMASVVSERGDEDKGLFELAIMDRNGSFILNSSLRINNGGIYRFLTPLDINFLLRAIRRLPNLQPGYEDFIDPSFRSSENDAAPGMLLSELIEEKHLRRI